MTGYSILSHTADIGLEARGATREELFENAAKGMFEFLTASGIPGAPFRTVVRVDGIDDETLLVNWLSELNYLYSVKRVVLDSFHVTELTASRLAAEVAGRQVPSEGHLLGEIKAVTYHDLAVTKLPDGTYCTRIIFDV